MKKLTIITLCLSLILTACTNAQASETTNQANNGIIQLEELPLPDVIYEFNFNQNQLTIEDENYIYFANYTSIIKMDKSTEEISTIYTDNLIISSLKECENNLYITTSETISSFNKTGENIISASLTDENGILQTGLLKVLGDEIYLQNFSSTDIMHKINPVDLSLEKADINLDLDNLFISPRGINYQNVSNGEYLSQLFYIDKATNERTQITSNNEYFIDNNKIVLTENYIFYTTSNPTQNENFSLYRADANGENTTLIDTYSNALYPFFKADSEHIYILGEENSIKINLETLKITEFEKINIENSYFFEITDEKIFYLYNSEPFYIDIVTNEIIYL